LRVTDSAGATTTAQVVISPGNHPPSVVINAPASTQLWKVGDPITFSATGTDLEDGTLPASAYSWNIILEHCPGGTCHEHQIETLNGVQGGTFIAPDHGYPAHLRLTVTVTDSGGLSTSSSVDIYPHTTTLTLQPNVAGATVAVDDTAGAGPITQTVIVGSTHVVTAPAQQIAGTVYDFDNWSDGGAQTHNITVSSPTTLTATISERDLRAVDAVINEPPPSSTTTVPVPIRLNKAASQPVTVHYGTVAGTATANVDYTPATGTLVFPPGVTEQDIPITILNDGALDGAQQFTIQLAAAQNANLTRPNATVTIQDSPTPVANAGADQTVNSGSTATIDASNSYDTGGQPHTYTWAQIDGPTATIDDPNNRIAHVTVPTGPATLTFRVTVTNTAGANTADDTNITIRPK
jgi:hypothetical protein